MRIITAVFLVLFVAPSSAEPLRVVTSFTILEDWVAIVGGDRVQVSSIVGRDSDTHAFRPAPSDARKIAGADLLIVNGLGFEGWLPRLIDASGFTGSIVVASDEVQLLAARDHQGTSESHQHSGHDDIDADPHAWHSIENAKRYVQNIQRALSERDPANTAYYQSNSDNYIEQLQLLQDNYKAAFDVVPQNQRKVVTAHDAFVYLAEDFGVELFAPQSSSVGIGSSARRVAKLVERIKHDRIRAVFLENITDPRLLEQVSAETGVSVGGHLYSDALSNAGGEAATYLQMMQHNLNAILKALTPSN